MEIGTEISRKIRTAIKGKLQELGAYVDEELPDYIMVMVANKKSQEQMTDDLSLFLGNNTSRFTTWLQGVLEKLRTVAPGSNSLKASEAIIFNSAMPPLKSREEKYHSAAPSASQAPPPSSDRATHETMAASRLTSAVRPLQDSSPSEAVIDIKLDVDDAFSEDLSYGAETSLYPRKQAADVSRTQRPPAQIYRPPGSAHSAPRPEQRPALPAKPIRIIGTTKPYEPQESSRASEAHRTGGAPHRAPRAQDHPEVSRKRKGPVASSVVKVRRLANHSLVVEEEEEEEDDLLQASAIPSSVSVPSRPERRPTLPPSKQANKNLILKAISEAQESITRTTSYPTVPPKQMVPVAPRTHLVSEEELILMKSRASMLRYQGQTDETPVLMSRTAMLRYQREPEETPVLTSRTAMLHSQGQTAETPVLMSRVAMLQGQTAESPALDTRQVGERRMDVLSRLQPEPMELSALQGQDLLKSETLHPADSRSFIIQGSKYPQNSPVQAQTPGDSPLQPGRLIQPRETPASEKPASPKFIVTLDGVPSPRAYQFDDDLDEEPMAYKEEGELFSQSYTQLAEPRTQEPDATPAKTKIPERCKYWPACKNGESCAYQHPTTACKAFPKCRFADKCFFIHPNCKFDAKCTKADCPYTHASKRTPTPPAKPAAKASGKVQCRFFPSCKNTECTYFHPKHCRFSNQCTRGDCEFYHPAAAVPPRHALTWTRAQASDADAAAPVVTGSL